MLPSGNLTQTNCCNLIDDIILTMKRHRLIEHLAQVLPDKRRNNSHIPFDILLYLAIAAKLKRKTSLMDAPFAVTEAEFLTKYSSGNGSLSIMVMSRNM